MQQPIRAWYVMHLFVDYLQNAPRKVQCRQLATRMRLVFVMREWVVGRDKHFTQHIVRIPAVTPHGYVMNY